MFQPLDRAQEFETTLQLVVNGYINGPSLRLRINWKKERAGFGDKIDLQWKFARIIFRRPTSLSHILPESAPNPKYFFRYNESFHLFATHCGQFFPFFNKSCRFICITTCEKPSIFCSRPSQKGVGLHVKCCPITSLTEDKSNVLVDIQANVKNM